MSPSPSLSFHPLRRRGSRPKWGGEAFSIADILIYTSIMILTASIAVNTSFPLIEQRRLRSAAIELSSYLHAARSVALATNIPCIINLADNDGGVFEPDASSQDNSCHSDQRNIAPDVNLGEYVGSRNLRADVAGNSGHFPVTFTPDGTTNADVTVLLGSTTVSAGVWCVNLQAPLATVRIGWRPQGESNCNYAIEQ
jgi:Tfp pilus assembly protein FimT